MLILWWCLCANIRHGFSAMWGSGCSQLHSHHSRGFCFSKWAPTWISANNGVAWASVGASDKSCSWDGISCLLHGTNSKHATLLTPSFPAWLLLLKPLHSFSSETIPAVMCPLTCFHGKEWAPALALIRWFVISPRELVLESAVPGVWQPPLCPEELCANRASSGFNCSPFLGLAQQLSGFGLKGRGRQRKETTQGCSCREKSTQKHSESKFSASGAGFWLVFFKVVSVLSITTKLR